MCAEKVVNNSKKNEEIIVNKIKVNQKCNRSSNKQTIIYDFSPPPPPPQKKDEFYNKTGINISHYEFKRYRNILMKKQDEIKIHTFLIRNS